jgi:hypothetical protein
MNKETISAIRYTVSGWLIMVIHLCAFIGVPILAYRFNNWWFLFGIVFVYIGFSFGWKRYTLIIIIFAALGVSLAVFNFFNQQLVAFYFICFSFGFIGIRLYRIIGLGDKTSRALISTVNSDVRQEISDEIEKGMNEFKNRKKSN